MPYYDPTSWIPDDDSLVPEVETRIIADKRATASSVRSRKAFLPPYAFDLDVQVKDSTEMMRLSLTKGKLGKVYISIASGELTLRNGHFNGDYHTNPDGTHVRPPNHIHFPTKNYPSLERRHTYAYHAISNTDYLSALKKICDDSNIDLRSVSLPLLQG